MCKVLGQRAFEDPGIAPIECGFLRRRNLKPGEGALPVEERVNIVAVDRAAGVTP